MTLTWTILIVGGMIFFGLPIAIVTLNRQKRNAGWWLFAGLIGFAVIGNVVERMITGSSPLF